MMNEEEFVHISILRDQIRSVGNFRFVEEVVENPLEWSLIHPEHRNTLTLSNYFYAAQ